MSSALGRRPETDFRCCSPPLHDLAATETAFAGRDRHSLPGEAADSCSCYCLAGEQGHCPQSIRQGAHQLLLPRLRPASTLGGWLLRRSGERQ